MARIAIYARVSTHKDQTVENQLLALRQWAEGRGHSVVEEYRDEGISGAKGREKRPGLDALMRASVNGRHDMVAVTALDRLGRSLQHLVQLTGELEALKIDLFVQNMSLDTSTPMGRLMFNVMGSFAEFERELIRERTVLGLERAKHKGKKLGRPTVSALMENKIAALLQAGVPVTRIRRLCRVGVSVIYRIKKELESCQNPNPNS